MLGLCSKNRQIPLWDLAIFLLGASLFLLFVSWAVFAVPMNNEEANYLHPLSCAYNTYSHLDASSMRGCDGRYDLLTVFGFAIPRSLPYVGSFHALLYAPLYFIFHDEVAQYFFGAFFFLVFAILLSRQTQNAQTTFLLLASFLPLVFGFIHDTGPIKFQMLLYPLGVILFNGILKYQKPYDVACGLILSVLFFCAIEEKIFFLYLLPGLCLFFLALSPRSFYETLSKIWCKKTILISVFLLFSGLVLMLLFAHDKGGHTYLATLISIEKGEVGLTNLDRSFSEGERWLRFIFFLPYYFNRYFKVNFSDDLGNPIFSYQQFLALVMSLVSFALLIFFLAYKYYRENMRRGISSRTKLLILSLLATIVVFLVLGNVWASHHFIFLWVPVLVLTADLLSVLSPLVRRVVLLLFFALNLGLLSFLLAADQTSEGLVERQKISAYFNEARAGASIVDYPSSWGYHLIQGLYGPKDQLVTRLTTSPDEMNRLFSLSKQTMRDVYFVCYYDRRELYTSIFATCNAELFAKQVELGTYRKVTFVEVLPDLKIWHVFRMLAN